jgi:hypothetical protein
MSYEFRVSTHTPMLRVWKGDNLKLITQNWERTGRLLTSFRGEVGEVPCPVGFSI